MSSQFSITNTSGIPLKISLLRLDLYTSTVSLILMSFLYCSKWLTWCSTLVTLESSIPTHINENKRNPKQLWNSLRDFSGTSVSSNIPHLNDAEGNLITSSSKTADMFNTHFWNIYRHFLQTVRTSQHISSNSTNWTETRGIVVLCTCSIFLELISASVVKSGLFVEFEEMYLYILQKCVLNISAVLEEVVIRLPSTSFKWGIVELTDVPESSRRLFHNCSGFRLFSFIWVLQ